MISYIKSNKAISLTVKVVEAQNKNAKTNKKEKMFSTIHSDNEISNKTMGIIE